MGEHIQKGDDEESRAGMKETEIRGGWKPGASNPV